MTWKLASLVGHDQARQAEIEIFQFLKVPGMVSCLTLTTPPVITFSFMGPTLQTHVQGAPFNRDSSGVSVVFSCSTVAYLVSKAVIGHISKKGGEVKTGLVCTLALGLTFLLLGSAPNVSSVPERTIVLFLEFSVGGITVPVETLMTKLVVCYYHGRGQSIQASHFSDSLAAMSGFAVTCGATVGRGGAVHTEGSFQEGDRESLHQIWTPLLPALRFRFEFVLPVRVGLLTCVLLGRVSGSMARQAGSRIKGLETCHTIKTLLEARDAPCSPFRRFESELSKTALTGYAAWDLPLSLEGASRLGPLLTPLPGSKRRTCALWVLLIVKAINWLFCAGWTKRESSMWHTRILSEQQDHEGPLPVQRGHVVYRIGRSPCEAGYHAAVTTTSSLPLLFFHASCHWRRSRDSDTGIQLDNLFAHIFSWIVAPGFVHNAADSQKFFDVCTCWQVVSLPPC